MATRRHHCCPIALCLNSRQSTERLLSKKPQLFKSFFGITVTEFDELHHKLGPVWAGNEINRLSQRQRQRAVGGGSDYKLDLCGRLLMTLMWLKLYLNMDALGFFFGVDKSTASRNVRNILTSLRQLGDETLGWPEPPKRGQTKDLDQALADYPDLMAVVDATEHSLPDTF